MTAATLSLRPLCADVSAAGGEPVAATASRVEHWLLVEYPGHWPYEPLDASVFAGRLRHHLAAQLAALPHSRLFLVKRPGRRRAQRVRVVYGATRERGRRFFQLELASHADLLGLDFAAALASDAPPGEPLEHPLLLVCTHGKRDRCCARYGQLLCEELTRRAPEDWAWQTSHVGGDRFAGNVVCLPEGLYFGRVAREDVARLLDVYLDGKIALERYRGSSCYPMPVQAAEIHVREATGLAGFYDLRVLSVRRSAPDGWRVELLAEVAGDVYEVEVGAELRDEVLLTCRAEIASRARRFVARSSRVSSS